MARSWKGKRSWRIPAGVGRDRYAALVASASSSSSAASSRDLAELDARLVRLEPGGGARELDDADATARRALEEPQGALDLGRPKRVPPPAQADERLLRGRELGELLGGELDVADREPPVERAIASG